MARQKTRARDRAPSAVLALMQDVKHISAAKTIEVMRDGNSKSSADVLRGQLSAFRDDLVRGGQAETARGLTRLLREFDFLTRRLQSRRA